MSDPLTPETPDEVDSAEAQSTGEAVESASTEITKERFNGLQAKLQTTLRELADEREARAALEQRAPSIKDTDMSDNDAAALAAELREVRAELAATRLADAKRDALREFPAAAPLADLIIGNSREEIRTVAEMISDRLGSVAPAAPASGDDFSDAEDSALDAAIIAAAEDAASSSPIVVPPTAPVAGGAYDAASPVVEQRKQAIATGDWDGFFDAAGRMASSDSV